MTQDVIARRKSALSGDLAMVPWESPASRHIVHSRKLLLLQLLLLKLLLLLLLPGSLCCKQLGSSRGRRLNQAKETLFGLIGLKSLFVCVEGKI